jgi:hypothetical protein
MMVDYYGGDDIGGGNNKWHRRNHPVQDFVDNNRFALDRKIIPDPIAVESTKAKKFLLITTTYNVRYDRP